MQTFSAAALDSFYNGNCECGITKRDVLHVNLLNVRNVYGLCYAGMSDIGSPNLQ